MFDTSSIPDTDEISAADFKLYITAIADVFTQTINLYSSNPASNTAIATTDYDYTDFGTTAFATGIATSAATTAAYNTWVLNASGLANISKKNWVK